MSQTPSSFTPTPYTPSGDAHYTPTQGTYKELKPFRYWCQKVLPLVYDDSLSYYELLCKVVDYLNKTMEDVDTLHDDVDNLHTAYTQLENDMNGKYHSMTQWINSSYTDLVNFVNTYFANLDVQVEINNKLDVMATNGTLSALIEPYVQPKVNNKINAMVASGEFADITDPKVVTEVNRKVNDMVNDGSFEDIVEPLILSLGNPIIVSSTDNMTDHSKIYILQSTGYLYYWNGSSFIPSSIKYADAITSLSMAIIGVSQLDTIVYDPANATITIPQCFFEYNGITTGLPAQTVTVNLNGNACAIFLNTQTKEVYTTAFGGTQSNDLCIGVIYGVRMWINGVDNVVVKSTGRMVNKETAIYFDYDDKSYYDTTNEVLHIAGGCVLYDGLGTGVAEQDIDISDIVGDADTYRIQVSRTNTIEVVSWSAARENNNPIIGYICNGQLYLNGRQNRSCAYIMTSGLADIVFDVENHTLSIGQGFIEIEGQTYSLPSHSISLNLSGGACVLYVDKATKNIYSVAYGNTVIHTDPIVGCIYGRKIFINGVPTDEIAIKDWTPNPSKGIGVYSGYSDYPCYDKTNHILHIPNGFYFYNGQGYSVSAQNIDTSSITTDAYTYRIKITYNGVVYLERWNGLNTNTDPVIGYLCKDQLQMVLNVIRTVAYAGINNGQYVTYDPTTKELSIPQCAIDIDGLTKSFPNQTITVTQNANFCCLYVNKYDRKVYSVPYGNITPLSDPILGYIYNNTIWINGIPKEHIQVKSKTICFFGDSITAGVGCNYPYHVHLGRKLNAKCLNYGIGSTGYVTTATGDVLVGNGVEGKGSTQTESSNNTILDVMTSVGSFSNCSIFGGTNDFGSDVPLATFRTAVQNTLDYALTKTSKVFVMGILKREGTMINQNGDSVDDFNDVIREECESRGIPFSLGTDVAINPNNSISKNAFMPDGLHPNDAGQTRIANYYERNLYINL